MTNAELTDYWLIYIPGFRHSLIKHFLVKVSGSHIFPPNWAWILILLIWVPGPQVALHGLYSPHSQSTGKETVHYINKKFSRIKFGNCRIDCLIDLRTFFRTFFDKAFFNNCIRIANFSTKLRFDNNTSCLKTFTTRLTTLAPFTIFAVHWKRNNAQQVFNNNSRTNFEKWVIADRWYGMNQTVQNKFEWKLWST